MGVQVILFLYLYYFKIIKQKHDINKLISKIKIDRIEI